MPLAPSIKFRTDFRGTPPRPFRRGKKGTFCIRVRVAGKDVWRSLRTTDQKTAEYYAIEIWRSNQASTAKSIIPIPPVSMLAVLNRYERSPRFDVLADSTKEGRVNAFTAFANFCAERFGVETIDEVTSEMVEEFCDRDGKAKNKYFNNLLGEISAVFKFYKEIPNPCENVDRRSVTRGSRASEPYKELSREQCARILLAIRQSGMKARREWFDACVVALNTGARYKDCAMLRFSDLHEDERGHFLMFSPKKTQTRTRNRVVLIRTTPELLSMIERRRKIVNGDFVFPHLAETAAKRSTNALSQVLRDRNVEGSFHCFRVSVISAADRLGIDLKDFGGVVGHSSISQTNAYSRAALEIDLSRLGKGMRKKGDL